MSFVSILTLIIVGILYNFAQPEKTSDPKINKEYAKFKLVSLKQFLNAFCEIAIAEFVRTPFWKIASNFWQFSNAEFPISLTLFGNVTYLILDCANARVAIFVTGLSHMILYN